MNLSYNAPCDIQGTIQVSKPLHGLGTIVDINSKRWDIKGIIGNYVQAVPESEMHSYYTNTSGGSFGGTSMTDGSGGVITQTWKPYLLEVVT